MENVMSFYVILYMIMGLIIYHAIFEIWYFNFGKALIGELFGALIFAVIMTGLTLKFWWVALIIIILIGLALSAKVGSPTGKKIVLVVFVVVAIITAITGIRYNKQEKEKQKEIERQRQEAAEEIERQKQEAAEEEALYYTPIDPEVYLKESSDLYSITEGVTYVRTEDGYCSANVQYDKDTYGIVYIQFLADNGERLHDVGWFELQNNADKPLIYIGSNGGQVEINSESSFVVSGYGFVEHGLEGNYRLVTNEDVDYYDSKSQNQGYYETNIDGDDDIYEGEYSYNNKYTDEISSEYILPNSSVDILTESDLESLSAQELTYARNEIYARHGYIFKSSELNDYFSGMSWYEPDESFSGNLEGVEQRNTTFISDYQKSNALEYKPN